MVSKTQQTSVSQRRGVHLGCNLEAIMPMPDGIPYLSEADVQRTMTMAEAVELAQTGIRADAAGRVVGAKFYMNVGDAGFIKPFAGYLSGEQQAFVKTFSFFPGNPEQSGCSGWSKRFFCLHAGFRGQSWTGPSPQCLSLYVCRRHAVFSNRHHLLCLEPSGQCAGRANIENPQRCAF